jgi:hypothetical protein
LIMMVKLFDYDLKIEIVWYLVDWMERLWKRFKNLNKQIKMFNKLKLIIKEKIRN